MLVGCRFYTCSCACGVVYMVLLGRLRTTCTGRISAASKRGEKAAMTAPHEAGHEKVAKGFRSISWTSSNNRYSRIEDVAQQPRWRTSSLQEGYVCPRKYVPAGSTAVARRTRADATARGTAVIKVTTKAGSWPPVAHGNPRRSPEWAITRKGGLNRIRCRVRDRPPL